MEDGAAVAERVPLELKPVKMKKSLYLLIPKGISELLELDETMTCTLTTELKDRSPVLHYTFPPEPPDSVRRSKESPSVKRVSKQPQTVHNRQI